MQTLCNGAPWRILKHIIFMIKYPAAQVLPAQLGLGRGWGPAGKCSLIATSSGTVFDSLLTQSQAEPAAAGLTGRGARMPSLLYAEGVAMLSTSAGLQGLLQLLDTLMSCCLINGLAFSIPKTEMVLFDEDHLQCH